MTVEQAITKSLALGGVLVRMEAHDDAFQTLRERPDLEHYGEGEYTFSFQGRTPDDQLWYVDLVR